MVDISTSRKKIDINQILSIRNKVNKQNLGIQSCVYVYVCVRIWMLFLLYYLVDVVVMGIFSRA